MRCCLVFGTRLVASKCLVPNNMAVNLQLGSGQVWYEDIQAETLNIPGIYCMETDVFRPISCHRVCKEIEEGKSGV